MAVPNEPSGWLPYLGLITLVAGTIWTASSITGDVKHNSDRITVLEANDKARTDGVMSIDRRTTRIEAKLDYLLPGKVENRDPNGVPQ